MLKIAMYHYVRNLKLSRYPKIKGLDFDDFVEQISYISKTYHCITIEDLLGFFQAGEDLPKNSILLTFDDGYSDHFDYVFPVLHKFKMQGVFFTPVRSVVKKEVLDVNKIHYILASNIDPKSIISLIKKGYERVNAGHNLPSFEKLEREDLPVSRFDSKEVIFIKVLLQKRLPLKIRSEIVSQLFAEVVTRDEHAFAEELYVNEWQLKCMNDNNMIIGSHSYDHFWLETLSEEEQNIQIRKSTDFLLSLGVDPDRLCIGYPYGSYNDTLLNIVKNYNYKLGFSTRVAAVDLLRDNRLTLPRLDTNDFYPKGKN